VYELVLYIHVLSAIIWVGGAFFAQVLLFRATRSSDPTDLPRLGAYLDYLGIRVFLPAAIVLFIAGLILVVQRFSFSQLWISISMLLWLVSVLVGALYLGPRSGKVGALFAAEGPTSVAGRAGLARILLVSRLELVSFAIIVALMTFKPG